MATTLPEETARTAIIIPFPTRAKKVEPVVEVVTSSEIDPQTRLINALAKLNAALALQKRAVVDFRGSLGTLRETVQGLHGSLVNYDSKLSNIRTGIEKIGAESRKTVEVLKDY